MSQQTAIKDVDAGTKLEKTHTQHQECMSHAIKKRLLR